MKKNTLIVSAMAICATAGIVVAGGNSKPVNNPAVSMPVYTQGGILDTESKNGSFNTWLKAVEITGLQKELNGAGPFTVFAPTDEAFAKLGQRTLEKIMQPANREMLRSVVMYHVVPGNITTSEASKLTWAETLNGQRFTINAKNGFKVDNASVVKSDIKCNNGVIHIIDNVIMPETNNLVQVTVSNGQFNTFNKLVTAAGLTRTLEGTGPFTLLAPTDAAFAKLPAGTVETLLKPENKARLTNFVNFHVIPGRVFANNAFKTSNFKTVQGTSVTFSNAGKTPMVNNAKITTSDIDASNGVIHVIDAVIMPTK